MKSNPSLPVCVALGLATAHTQACAASQDAAQLPEVVVTEQAAASGSAADGYRVEQVTLGPLGNSDLRDTPLSIATVSADLIQNTQATNTGEALKYVPTVYTNTGASQITPYFTLRGFSASTWTYNMALDGLRAFDIYQPLDDKERVEVLSGATGFLYGVTSPAGIINHVLKRPTQTPLHRFTVGTDDQQVYGQLDLGGPIESLPGVTYRLNLAYADPGETGVEDQTQERYVFSGAVDWQMTPDTKLALDASRSQRELEQAQALFMTSAKIGIPDAPDASQNWGAPYTNTTDATTRLGAALEHRFNDTFSLRAKVRYTDIERDYVLNRQVWQNARLDYKWRVDSQQTFHTIVNQYALFLDAAFTTGPFGHALSLGGTQDAFSSGNNGYRGTTYSKVYPGNLYGDPSYAPWSLPPAGTSTSQATDYSTLVLTDRISLGERWSLLLGGTQAQVNDTLVSRAANGKTTTSDYDEGRFTPAVSLSFKPIEQVTTYVSYVEGLQQGFVAGSTTANAGEVFEPFVSEQLEAGVKARLWGLDLSAAWFDIDQANQYVDPATNRASQDGRAIHQGWEFSATGSPIERVRLTGGFTLLDATIDKASANEGKTPQGVPEEMARLYAEYDLPWVAGLTVTGGLSYTGKVPWDAANTLYVDPVTLYDAGLRYQRQVYGKDTTWRLTVANLTDEDYWTTRSGILYLGSPRTVSLSMSVDF